MKQHLYIIVLLFLGTPAWAQPRFDNLDQYLAFTRQHNPSLEAERLTARASHERLRSAWAAMLPQVKAFGSLDNNIALPVQLVPAQLLGGTEGEYAKVQFGTRYAAAYGAEASLSLLNLSHWKNVEASRLGEKASDYQQADRELTIVEQATTAYYMVLLSREAVVLNTSLSRASDSLLNVAQSRLSQGMIETLEYNRVKAVSLESLQQLRESEASFDKNINILKSLAGLEAKDTLILEENFNAALEETNTTTLKTSVEALPRYKTLTYRKLQASEDLKRQRTKILPELSLYARYTHQSFSQDLNSLSSQPWFDAGVVGVRAEWMLFTGFNRKAGIRQASLQAQVADRERQAYALQAGKELNELAINHQVAAHGLARYREHYELNATNYTIAGEKYKEGIYTVDQYITIYQELVRSQNQYLGELARYFIYESMIKTRNELQ